MNLLYLTGCVWKMFYSVTTSSVTRSCYLHKIRCFTNDVYTYTPLSRVHRKIHKTFPGNTIRISYVTSRQIDTKNALHRVVCYFTPAHSVVTCIYIYGVMFRTFPYTTTLLMERYILNNKEKVKCYAVHSLIVACNNVYS